MTSQSSILTRWIRRLTDLLVRRTGAEPTIRRNPGALFEHHATALWWRCDLAGKTIFVGATEDHWRALAELLAPGEDCDARQVYLQFLEESFGSRGAEADQGPASAYGDTVDIGFADAAPIRLQLVAEAKPAPAQSAIGCLSEIELPLTIRLGKARMLLGDLLAVKAGSTIVSDRYITDPVEILVNGKIVAQGEAVVVQGNYGVRIIEVAGDRNDSIAGSQEKKP
jgi:flagellar motor switch protein FliN/FliY